MMKNKFSLFRVAVAVITVALCGVVVATTCRAVQTGDNMAGFGIMLTIFALPILLFGGWDIMHE